MLNTLYQILFGSSTAPADQEFSFLSKHPSIAAKLEASADQLSDEAVIKILRQLQFWCQEDISSTDLEKLLSNLLKASLGLQKFKVPSARFGKTELAMPIITCGGMRLQHTWCPDSLPISPSKATVLTSSSQANLKACILKCIQHNMIHFETARMYGTSEMQFSTALGELIKEGTIQRTDFILQTKIVPKSTRQEFETLWNQSWNHWKDTVGFIDLFAIHVVSSTKTYNWVMQEDGVMSFLRAKQQEGCIRHIGFSTHGTSRIVYDLVNSNMFSFVNMHCHFFGDYHATGTMNNVGSAGNRAALKRALELDMGVFQISPLDKGGKVYRPSRKLAKLLGPDMPPIAFVMLHGWKTLGFHTTSIGVSRPADLDDVLWAAYLSTLKETNAKLNQCEERLTSQMTNMLGQKWYDQGLLHLPDCEQPITQGMAIGHILWLHNLVSCFGMYDFCRDRYASLENCAWNNARSFEENIQNFDDGNMGRSYVDSVCLEEALVGHYDVSEVRRRLREAHEWLCLKNRPPHGNHSDRGWEQAYNLTCWDDYPGGSITKIGVVLQVLSMNYLGVGGGPEKSRFESYAQAVRKCIAVYGQLVDIRPDTMDLCQK